MYSSAGRCIVVTKMMARFLTHTVLSLDYFSYLVYTTSKVKPCSLSSLPAAWASFTPSAASDTSSQPGDDIMNKSVRYGNHQEIEQSIYTIKML
jgi:hypothetical protein